MTKKMFIADLIGRFIMNSEYIAISESGIGRETDLAEL